MKLKQDYGFWFWIGGAMLFLVAISVFVIISNINTKAPVPASTESTTQPNTSLTDSVVDSSVNDSDSSSYSSSTPESESSESGESKSDSSQKTESQTYTTPSTTPSCYHEEDGRCWDDLEDEAYSAGLYDSQFGYYGATLEYAEDCNALCREIIEDAYDEGYADGM